ncbi:MAG TPA: low molecular weight protein arginine phosphatase [Methylomusa anaerophila]|uniref:Low molecular weight protein-tyrosine-phosphatase YwlE n=1 Tax=Methylomusa anaerophila TaxID=1930071 RepID=A0A348AKA2_9FIRM|nr:low molecular weight protein-tyrosine-phosphatase YwlE [Methylomusa anaerophila]HML89911.1 low molecular weight protein arginine phosphatase [Methylomusa anaerophila]
MFKVLLVCTGNTCRSPMAEAILQDKFAQNNVGRLIRVESAGLAGAEEPAAKPARAAIRRWGLNIDNHRSRRLTPAMVQAAGLILTMTRAHKQAVCRLLPQATGKVHTLSEFADESADIFDPFGGSENDYRECASQINRLLDKSWQKIVKLAGNEE